MREVSKRTIQISIALGAIVGLIGCGGDQASDIETGTHDLAATSRSLLKMSSGRVIATLG